MTQATHAPVSSKRALAIKRLADGSGRRSDSLPLQYAKNFAVYRPTQFKLRPSATESASLPPVCTQDGKHRLNNGGLFTLKGFTPQGDLVVDRGWVIGREFGHVALGYCVTSHKSEGKTVDKVFIGLSSESFPATSQRTLYVAATRGREQVVLFTDKKRDLLRAVQRPDEPMSATELVASSRRQTPLRKRLYKHVAFLRRIANVAKIHELRSVNLERTPSLQREIDHGR